MVTLTFQGHIPRINSIDPLYIMIWPNVIVVLELKMATMNPRISARTVLMFNGGEYAHGDV